MIGTASLYGTPNIDVNEGTKRCSFSIDVRANDATSLEKLKQSVMDSVEPVDPEPMFSSFSPISGELVKSGHSDTTFNPGSLQHDSHYYWQIIAKDEHGVTSRSPVWSFTTTRTPTADYDYSPSNPTVGEEVTFDAANSTDPDGSITSYEWDFDGDGNPDAIGQSVSHSFQSSDVHTVSLTVTDSDGISDSVLRTISVAEELNHPPSAAAGPNQTVTEGDPVTLDGSGSKDPDDDQLSYSWKQTQGP